MSYIKESRGRAKRRKSLWNLLLVPAVLVPLALIWAGSVILAEDLHAAIHPGQNLTSAVRIGPILTVISPLFGALPVSMLLGNVIVRMVPAARRALDLEATGFPGTSFKAAQSKLRNLALYLVPTSAVLCAIGSVLPW